MPERRSALEIVFGVLFDKFAAAPDARTLPSRRIEFLFDPLYYEIKQTDRHYATLVRLNGADRFFEEGALLTGTSQPSGGLESWQDGSRHAGVGLQRQEVMRLSPRATPATT